MLLIRAVSFKGQPVPPELSARFDESGGTIGRGEHSTLVLPDPERYISRTHTVAEAPPPEELKALHFGDVHMIVREADARSRGQSAPSDRAGTPPGSVG